MQFELIEWNLRYGFIKKKKKNWLGNIINMYLSSIDFYWIKWNKYIHVQISIPQYMNNYWNWENDIIIFPHQIAMPGKGGTSYCARAINETASYLFLFSQRFTFWLFTIKELQRKYFILFIIIMYHLFILLE